jgi:hypothetical protein
VSDTPSDTWTTLSTVIVAENLDKLSPTFSLALVASTDGAVSPWTTVGKKANGWSYSSSLPSGYTPPAMLIAKPGSLVGKVQVPPGFGPVGAVLVRVDFPGAKDEGSAAYLESITFSEGTLPIPRTVPVHSYLFAEQGTRVFFSSDAFITQKTPAALLPYRQGDLEVTQGLRVSLDDNSVPKIPYQPWHRVYK